MSENEPIKEEIESPCLRLCAVDGRTGFCMGCYRTLKEITSWARLTPEARRDIMAELEERKEKHGPLGHTATAN